jgi:hypothetical protein
VSQFKVGDVVEVVQSMRGLEGHEGVIVMFLESREGHVEPDKNIRVRLNGIDSGSPTGCFRYGPWQLRLKRPPSYPGQHTAGDWDLCPWKPGRVRA